MALFTSTVQNITVKSLSQVHASNIGVYPNIMNNSNLLMGLTNFSVWPGCRLQKQRMFRRMRRSDQK
jgi:hypothetical protein